jgi:FkbM family methyltransferase
MLKIDLIYVHGHFFDSRRIKDGSVIVDAGACYGEMEYTFFEDMKIKPIVYAIEPAIQNLKRIKESAGRLGWQNFNLIERVLCGQGEPAELPFTEFIDKIGRYSQWANASGMHEESAKQREDMEKIVRYNVSTLTINSLFDYVKEPKIDYLKVDIEGSERGIFNTIDRSITDRIDQLSVEIHYGDEVDVFAKKITDFGFNFVTVCGSEIYATRIIQ